MKRKIDNSDWTEVLKDRLKDYELVPSDSLYERLEAGSSSEPKGAWWWPVLVIAAALTSVGIFLFRSGEESLPEQMTKQITAEVVLPEIPVQPEVVLLPEVVTHPEAVTRPELIVPELEEIVASACFQKEPCIADAGVRSREVPGMLEVFEPDERPDLMPEQSRVFKERRKKRQITVGVSFGSGLFASAATVTPGASGSRMRKSASRYDIGDVLEHSPQSYRSIDLFIPILDRLYLETGVSTTELHASFQSINQDLVFNGVPLRLGCTVLDWGWGDVSLNVGGMWEYCSRAFLMSRPYDEPSQWSASAGLKASLHLFKSLGLYASPSFSYYFTDTVLPTIRNRKPFYVSVCAGLYIEF